MHVSNSQGLGVSGFSWKRGLAGIFCSWWMLYLCLQRETRRVSIQLEICFWWNYLWSRYTNWRPNKGESLESRKAPSPANCFPSDSRASLGGHKSVRQWRFLISPVYSFRLWLAVGKQTKEKRVDLTQSVSGHFPIFSLEILTLHVNIKNWVGNVRPTHICFSVPVRSGHFSLVVLAVTHIEMLESKSLGLTALGTLVECENWLGCPEVGGSEEVRSRILFLLKMRICVSFLIFEW